MHNHDPKKKQQWRHGKKRREKRFFSNVLLHYTFLDSESRPYLILYFLTLVKIGFFSTSYDC